MVKLWYLGIVSKSDIDAAVLLACGIIWRGVVKEMRKVSTFLSYWRANRWRHLTFSCAAIKVNDVEENFAL